MHNQATRGIFDYWINLKGNDTAPLRAMIEPAALRHLLPDLFILSTDQEGVLAFRLAGTRICELFDREFRNQSFEEVWETADRHQTLSVAGNVMRHEQPALLDVTAANAAGREREHEMLLLPLRSSETERSDRVLGSLLPHGRRMPPIDLPVARLSLDNWTFLTGSGSHFGVPVVSDQRDPSWGLRRLLPRALRPQNKAC